MSFTPTTSTVYNTAVWMDIDVKGGPSPLQTEHIRIVARVYKPVLTVKIKRYADILTTTFQYCSEHLSIHSV